MKAVKPDLGQTSFRRSTQFSVLTSLLDFVYSQYMYCFLTFVNSINKLANSRENKRLSCPSETSCLKHA